LLDAVEQIGAFAGLAAFLGLAVLALLSFTHGRDIRRLRDWAGSAPERDAERKEATSAVAAQRAEELRALEEGRTAERDALDEREERRIGRLRPRGDDHAAEAAAEEQSPREPDQRRDPYDEPLRVARERRNERESDNDPIE